MDVVEHNKLTHGARARYALLKV